MLVNESNLAFESMLTFPSNSNSPMHKCEFSDVISKVFISLIRLRVFILNLE